MKSRAFRLAVLLALVIGTVYAIYRSTEGWSSPRLQTAQLSPPPVVFDEAAHSREVIAFLERRIRHDPGDADALARLAGCYLQALRETGALEDLSLARRAARASLASVPAVRNTDGFTALVMAEFAAHEFGSARDHARALARLDSTGTPYALLGDALAELGRYQEAERAYGELRRRSGGASSANVATRMARMAQLHGDNAGAERQFTRALALERETREPSHERIAWYQWQLGDIAFFGGNFARAQRRYDAALEVYPGYFRASASLGRLQAARGNFAQAIVNYQAAIRQLPDPTFVAELGDVYTLRGSYKEARRQYNLVELIGHLGRLNGVMYNRQLAMFYADHDTNAREAYADAKREFAFRRDILGADVLAWTALKAGNIPAARVAMGAALRLGTRDPRLFYHAGLIARASGRNALARRYLEGALRLNPQFDPLQAIKARQALRALSPA